MSHPRILGLRKTVVSRPLLLLSSFSWSTLNVSTTKVSGNLLLGYRSILLSQMVVTSSYPSYLQLTRV